MKTLQIRIVWTLAAAAALAAGGRAQEKKDNFERWEKAIAAFEKQDEAKPFAKDGFVFVGSSSIGMWKLNVSFPDMPVLNRGFGGSHLADSARFASRLVNKHKPKVVVLYAGDNDIGAGKTPERVADDFKLFVKNVHADVPKAKIVFVAIKPSIARWKLVDKVKQANSLIEAECKKDDRLVYLDVFGPMLGDDGMPQAELYLKDGLHMTEKGYAIWNKLLKPHLK